jgi:hypothetical protein
MTKKLEEVFDLPPSKEEYITPPPAETAVTPEVFTLEDRLEEFDKISAALPRVKGLGDISDAEFDSLAAKAEQAYDDLMDLGMNVEARHSTKMFEVAAQMMNAAITAKTNKIDKKLKMVDLQLKKLAIDRKNAPEGGETNAIEGQGFILTDRNSILEKLKNLNK